MIWRPMRKVRQAIVEKQYSVERGKKSLVQVVDVGAVITFVALAL